MFGASEGSNAGCPPAETLPPVGAAWDCGTPIDEIEGRFRTENVPTFSWEIFAADVYVGVELRARFNSSCEDGPGALIETSLNSSNILCIQSTALLSPESICCRLLVITPRDASLLTLSSFSFLRSNSSCCRSTSRKSDSR